MSAVPRITIPGTDLNVSRICLGTWQFNDNKETNAWEAQSEEVSRAIVTKCLEVGINFFDTAEGYAGSEQVLGRALQGRRQEAIIATKFGFREGPNTPPYTAVQIDEAITKALTKLQTSYVDLLQIHFPSFVADVSDCVKELNRQIALGRIRYYGLSNYGPKNLKNFLDLGGKPVSNQMGYNLLWRSAEHEVIPLCKENNISILAYSPLQQGLLTGKFTKLDDVPMGRRLTKLFHTSGNPKTRHGQDGAEDEMFTAIAKMKNICQRANVDMGKASLAWLLQQDNVPVAITGASSPDQIVKNIDVPTLPQSVVQELTDATEPVKAKIGKVLDQWAHPDRCE
ncbi:1-deoxyxylulose-5-phosphate synthase YajO-like isoform X1 [Mytilus galloprovincialis]|uniref:1-deoxyxylulose-5-phosphate synthase YajO-like isoform X1 n=1 Tax=Mytilus galloprovincialis TaxID=29158 RepID=UPI003F7B625D